MKKIQNIIVATDFSLTARNAYRYASALANALNASLTVVNVKENLIMVSDVMATPFPVENNKEVIKDIEELIAEENAATHTIERKVNIKILSGDPVIVLTDLSKNNDTDLIVIGATGLADVLTKIFGSVSIKVSNKAHCPVILVPRDAKWESIKHIMFASNYDSVTKQIVQYISAFATTIQAKIHFVNIKKPHLLPEVKENNWEQFIVEVEPGLSFEKHTIYGVDTVEKLKKYGKENNINLLAFASKHRNFWENLMHKSITENMALAVITPILVMHIDDENN
ncbi:MAG: universal stress protein [Bacteroidetes bacterium]|nr:universal stress protein [Bacteroidota bacterium]